MSDKDSKGATSRGVAKPASLADRGAWPGLVFAVVVTGLALLVRFLLDPFLGNHLPYVTFFVAVAAATWRAGLMASLLTVALGALASDWFFMPPRHSFVIDGMQQKVGMATYFMVSLAFVAFGYALQKARRRADREREQLRVTLGSIGDAVIATDTQGKVTFLNPVAASLTGWTADETRGKPLASVLNMIGEQSRQTVENPVKRVLRDGLNAELANHTLLIAKDGREIPIADSAAPIRDRLGQIVGVVMVFRDRADERKAEKALFESEARKSAVLDSSLDGVITMDARGLITEFNPAAEALFGHSAAQVIGRPLADVIIPQRLREAHSQGLARYLATSEGRVLDRRIEMPALRADGTEFLTELSIRRVTGIEPPLFSGFLRDITSRKQAEEALRESQTELEEANDQLASRAKQLEALVQQRTAKLTETIGELEGFSYSITHDLRAPLRAVNSFSQMLAEEYGEKLDEHGKQLLDRIGQSVTRMDKLIRDVLQYSCVLRMDLKLEPVNPDQLVRGMLQSYPDFQEPKATVVIASPLPHVLANEAALMQCFSNLLNNAVKFVPVGTKPSVVIRPETKESTVRFWIEDNGIGIEPEYLEKIFELFQRLSNEYEGTGVGLSIVRKAVERMGGTAGVESELGKGSRFWIELSAAGTEKENV